MCVCVCVCVCVVNLTFHSLKELMGIILSYGFRQIVHLHYWHFQVSAAGSNTSCTELHSLSVHSDI